MEIFQKSNLYADYLATKKHIKVLCSKLWSTQIVRNFKSENANGTQIQNASTQMVRNKKLLTNNGRKTTSYID